MILTFSNFSDSAAGPPFTTTTVRAAVTAAENNPNMTSPTKNQIMANALAASDLGVRSPYLQHSNNRLDHDQIKIKTKKIIIAIMW